MKKLPKSQLMNLSEDMNEVIWDAFKNTKTKNADMKYFSFEYEDDEGNIVEGEISITNFSKYKKWETFDHKKYIISKTPKEEFQRES